MSLLDAFFLGVVEGITEFLPVSSTGHLILAGRLLGVEQTEFMKSFDIAIQLGAILAVLVLYGKKLLLSWEIQKRVLAAFLPTAVIGLVAYKTVKKFLLGDPLVVLAALFLGGVLLIVFEKFHKENDGAEDNLERLSYRKALLIGLFQAAALVPGVSRAAATILGGLILGVRRKAIVEFSFYLAVPTMAAATALDLLKTEARFSGPEIRFLAIGSLTAFFVALFAIRFLLRYIEHHRFTAFGVYRIAAAAVFGFILF